MKLSPKCVTRSTRLFLRGIQCSATKLNAVWVDENEFPPKTKWLRNNQLLGYESSEFGYESPGYQKNVGTKQLVSVTFSAKHWQPEHLFTSFPISVKYKEGENQQHSAKKSRLQYFFLFYAGRSGLREIWIK